MLRRVQSVPVDQYNYPNITASLFRRSYRRLVANFWLLLNTLFEVALMKFLYAALMRTAKKFIKHRKMRHSAYIDCERFAAPIKDCSNFRDPGLTAMVKHDDHAKTWYDYGDSYSPWYDHGKIITWSSWNIGWSCHGEHDHYYNVLQTLFIEPTSETTRKRPTKMNLSSKNLK